MYGLLAIHTIKTSIFDDFLKCCVRFIKFENSGKIIPTIDDPSNILEYYFIVATVAP
jgi:hypothetical protein